MQFLFVNCDVPWENIRKKAGAVVPQSDLKVFSQSKDVFLYRWSQSNNATCATIGGVETLWRTEAGAVKEMGRMPGGQKGCSNVTKYDLHVLMPPRNGVLTQITFSASEEGFDNAWNEQSKQKTLLALEKELSEILRTSVLR